MSGVWSVGAVADPGRDPRQRPVRHAGCRGRAPMVPDGAASGPMGTCAHAGSAACGWVRATSEGISVELGWSSVSLQAGHSVVAVWVCCQANSPRPKTGGGRSPRYLVGNGLLWQV